MDGACRGGGTNWTEHTAVPLQMYLNVEVHACAKVALCSHK